MDDAISFSSLEYLNSDGIFLSSLSKEELDIYAEMMTLINEKNYFNFDTEDEVE